MKLYPAFRAHHHSIAVTQSFRICRTEGCDWRGRNVSGSYCSDCGQPPQEEQREVPALSATPQTVRDRLAKLRPHHRLFSGYDVYCARDGIELKLGAEFEGVFALADYQDDVAVLKESYDSIQPVWFAEE